LTAIQAFPPFLKLTHVATMAGPYTGYSLLAELCHIIVVNVQCDEMFPFSSFIEGLKNPQALVPQGPDGTLWSGIGSNADFFDNSDGFVSSASATSMEIPKSAKMILPWYKFVFHTMYTHNKKVIANVVDSLALTMYKSDEVFSNIRTDELTAWPSSAVDAVIARGKFTQDFSQLPQDQLPGKVDPYVVNDETRGFQFTNILPTGLFAKMGIQEGDIVRGCSEENINSPFDALDSLETSNSPIHMNFCIVRGEKTLSKKIVVQ
jgi:hypothetical protein